MISYSEDDLLMLSGIQHFAFCERQWALIHLEQQWQENVRTVEGRIIHDRVHTPLLVESRGSMLISRSLPVVSWELGLYGVLDLVEFYQVGVSSGGVHIPGRKGFWKPRPVEYKRGKPKPDSRDEVQLCAQAICLEEMLQIKIDEGDLYYGEIRRRTCVSFDDELRQQVFNLSQRMHMMYEKGITPPATKGKHCRACSLYDICLPSLTGRTKSVKEYIRKEIQMKTEEEE